MYDPEDIVRCRHCGVYGMAAEFVNQRYCNTSCQEGAALKKAAEFKREQEHRALKLRRKRRRLEQISVRGSLVRSTNFTSSCFYSKFFKCRTFAELNLTLRSPTVSLI